MNRVIGIALGVAEFSDERVPWLKYAGRDAEEFFHSVLRRYPGADMSLLVNGDATCDAIESELQRIEREVQGSDQPVRVVVYLSGHGGCQGPSSTFHFLAHDADLDQDPPGRCLDLERLKRFFDIVGRGNGNERMLLADCCYAASETDRDTAKSKSLVVKALPHSQSGGANQTGSDRSPYAAIYDVGCVVLAACQPHGIALEATEYRHGLFTHFLLSALEGRAEPDGDGATRPHNLLAYVEKSVSRYLNGSGLEEACKPTLSITAASDFRIEVVPSFVDRIVPVCAEEFTELCAPPRPNSYRPTELHRKVEAWLRSDKERVLCLTGAGLSGKSTAVGQAVAGLDRSPIWVNCRKDYDLDTIMTLIASRLPPQDDAADKFHDEVKYLDPSGPRPEALKSGVRALLASGTTLVLDHVHREQLSPGSGLAKFISEFSRQECPRTRSKLIVVAAGDGMAVDLGLACPLWASREDARISFKDAFAAWGATPCPTRLEKLSAYAFVVRSLWYLKVARARTSDPAIADVDDWLYQLHAAAEETLIWEIWDRLDRPHQLLLQALCVVSGPRTGNVVGQVFQLVGDINGVVPQGQWGSMLAELERSGLVRWDEANRKHSIHRDIRDAILRLCGLRNEREMTEMRAGAAKFCIDRLEGLFDYLRLAEAVSHLTETRDFKRLVSLLYDLWCSIVDRGHAALIEKTLVLVSNDEDVWNGLGALSQLRAYEMRIKLARHKGAPSVMGEFLQRAQQLFEEQKRLRKQGQPSSLGQNETEYYDIRLPYMEAEAALLRRDFRTAVRLLHECLGLTALPDPSEQIRRLDVEVRYRLTHVLEHCNRYQSALEELDRCEEGVKEFEKTIEHMMVPREQARARAWVAKHRAKIAARRASIYVRNGQHGLARREAAQCHEHNCRHLAMDHPGDPFGLAIAYTYLALSMARGCRGKRDRLASRFFADQALLLLSYRRVLEPSWFAKALMAKTQVLLLDLEGDVPEALARSTRAEAQASIAQAEEWLTRRGQEVDEWRLGEVKLLRAELARQAGDEPGAAQFAKAALECAGRMGHHELQARVCLFLGSTPGMVDSQVLEHLEMATCVAFRHGLALAALDSLRKTGEFYASRAALLSDDKQRVAALESAYLYFITAFTTAAQVKLSLDDLTKRITELSVALASKPILDETRLPIFQRIHERRNHPRFPYSWPGTLELAGGSQPIPVELLDISASGLCCLAKSTVGKGKECTVELQAPGSEPRRIKGVVLREDPAKPMREEWPLVLGMQFADAREVFSAPVSVATRWEGAEDEFARRWLPDCRHRGRCLLDRALAAGGPRAPSAAPHGVPNPAEA